MRESGRLRRLGIKYNLLTAYTSFVAIDAQPRRQGADAVTVKQPLPLPRGVSDNALPGNAPYAQPTLSYVPRSGSGHYGSGGSLKAKSDPYRRASKPPGDATLPSSPANPREAPEEVAEHARPSLTGQRTRRPAPGRGEAQGRICDRKPEG